MAASAVRDTILTKIPTFNQNVNFLSKISILTKLQLIVDRGAVYVCLSKIYFLDQKLLFLTRDLKAMTPFFRFKFSVT